MGFVQSLLDVMTICVNLEHKTTDVRLRPRVLKGWDPHTHQ